MQKSSLNLYIQKLAAGDLSFADKLCDQLADRLIYAPLAPSTVAEENGRQLKVSIMRLAEANRSVVCIFTSEDKFKSWAEQTEHKGGSISLLGADFCAALGELTWLRVDPGSLASIDLQPTLVARIAKSETVGSSSVTPNVKDANSLENTALGHDKTSPGLVRQALFAQEPLPEQYTSTKAAFPHNDNARGTKELAASSTTRLASAAVFASKTTEVPSERLSSQMTSGHPAQEQAAAPVMESAATLAATSTAIPRPVIFSSAEKKPLPLPAEKPKHQPGGAGKSFLRFLKGK
jgi:hypothetical protein